MPPPSQDVSARVNSTNQILMHARKTNILKVDISLSRMPLPEVRDATQRKQLFIVALLPAILRENARIEKQRVQAANLPTDSDAYSKLAKKYGLEENVTRKKLLEHIDTLPPSLVLAQGAIESGWGRSRFAREGNAFFGERTFDMDSKGIVPTGAEKGDVQFKVKSFSGIGRSVQSYFNTLNTHDAYVDLRKQRAELREKNLPVTGITLAPMLLNYSEIGDKYVRRLTATIRGSSLMLYDQVELEN